MEKTIDLERKKRLIVLVPECLVGNLNLANKILWIALRDQCEVIYLALVGNEEKWLSTTYSMAVMKAVTAGKCLIVQSRMAQTDLWLKTLREVYSPGDRIVCQQEQSVRQGFFKTIPLTEYLHHTLDVPVIALSGFYHPEQAELWKWFRTFVIWLGFLFILLGFSAFEIQVDTLLQGVLGKVLLCLLVTLEIGAIWAWDSLVG